MYLHNYIDVNSLISCSEGPEWKALRSELNPVVVPRKLGKHVQRLDAVSETFVEMMQESVQDDGYSTDLMDLLLYWSAEGELCEGEMCELGDVCVW